MRIILEVYGKYCFTAASYVLTCSSLLWLIRRQGLHNVWCIDIMGINGSTFVMVDIAFNSFYFHNDIEIALQETASEKSIAHADIHVGYGSFEVISLLNIL